MFYDLTRTMNCVKLWCYVRVLVYSAAFSLESSVHVTNDELRVARLEICEACGVS